ncbi:MAG: hypothetical protein JWL79_1185 [Frankiales bacterium]|nr:hypothetical protein [Frankiales bacterium]
MPPGPEVVRRSGSRHELHLRLEDEVIQGPHLARPVLLRHNGARRSHLAGCRCIVSDPSDGRIRLRPVVPTGSEIARAQYPRRQRGRRRRREGRQHWRRLVVVAQPSLDLVPGRCGRRRVIGRPRERGSHRSDGEAACEQSRQQCREDHRSTVRRAIPETAVSRDRHPRSADPNAENNERQDGFDDVQLPSAELRERREPVPPFEDQSDVPDGGRDSSEHGSGEEAQPRQLSSDVADLRPDVYRPRF